jgi:hypothetical protein
MHSIHLEPNLKAITDSIDPSGWLLATDSPTAIDVLRPYNQLERLEIAHQSDQDSFEHLVTEAVECWLEQRQQKPLLWIHSRGLRGSWDAPYEYRKLMCDSEDPDPPSDPIPPSLLLPNDFDPDLLFGIACGAGAQSVCIDQGIGLIEQTLAELGMSENCWIALAGLLGYPLGEHRRVGLGHREAWAQHTKQCVSDAFSERLHTPWIIRPAPAFALGTRSDALVQPATLGNWIRRIPEGNRFLDFEDVIDKLPIAWAIGVDEIAIVTNRWSGRFNTVQAPTGQVELAPEGPGEVYCFPEDRWQQNEIASRVPEVLELLSKIASILLQPPQNAASNSQQLGTLLTELNAIRR